MTAFLASDEEFNEAQQQAVDAPLDSHLLVLAGAGSGKTRVLVHRIAKLIEQGISPYEILAVTFTNKAAHEMQARLDNLIGFRHRGMWVGTFHGIAHRFLRMHWQEAKLTEHFQILDSEDQYRLVRRLLKQLDLDEKNWPPKQVQWFINGQKDAKRRAKDCLLEGEGGFYIETMQKIYFAYEDACDRLGAVDFAELLLRMFEVLRDQEILLVQYQKRFRYILVDEFQDTNIIQYDWIKLLAGLETRVMVVGDDDQSIYGWRGAQVDNILDFASNFAGTQTIRLEQNYRSTPAVLAAANALIGHNDKRLGKDLWTARTEGELISVYGAFNEIDEARFIVSCLQDWQQRGNARRECAILYRSNAQSRVLEEALLAVGMPYRIYGGLRFFERAEIKDALGYLRLIVNPHDDSAFERVINTPPRGIGERTIMSIREQAKQCHQSLWQAMQTVIHEKLLPGRALGALEEFVKLIQHLVSECRDIGLGEQVQMVLSHTELVEFYKKDYSEKGQSKIENLEELVSSAKQFTVEEDLGLSPLLAFLSHASLEAGEGQADANSDCVQLMTLHAAKGLEFPLVVICGVEEGLFPSQMSLNEEGRLEEERRLCYVGITRAMKKLYLTYAEKRRIHGHEEYHRPSRFLDEIPAEVCEQVRVKSQVQRPALSTTMRSLTRPTMAMRPTQVNRQFEIAAGFSIGQRVVHASFGEGVIVNYEGADAQARVQVHFKQAGSKWLLLNRANLETA
jgi:DNA helicase II / ATP-dependent DNA helicase PcrA